MYDIDWLDDALDALQKMTSRDERRVYDIVDRTLTFLPAQESLNLKRLRPNSLAGWELRISNFRVFYDVNEDERLVSIIAIGKKTGGQLRIHGRDFEL